MKLGLDRVLGLLVLAALALGAVWLMRHTEWVDHPVPTPPRGEAKEDQHYAVKQIARRLGANVVSARSLQPLPPTSATLVLGSDYWDLMPGAVLALQHWVEAGGHLVIPTQLATREGGSSEWIPIEQVAAPKAKPSNDENPEEDAGDKSAAKPAPAMRSPKPAQPFDNCAPLTESSALQSAFGLHRSYRVCGFGYGKVLKAHSPALWALDDRRGHHQWLRVRVGQGSVTATGQLDVFANHFVLHSDHALAFAAATELAPGRTLWFVTEEAPSGLLSLIWRRGAPAVLLAALLVLALLWRGAPRFGPPLPQSLGGRRSMAEQVRGMAAFLLARGPLALHKAQHRALEEAARQHLPGFADADQRRRAEAIAAATGLDADALLHALTPTGRYERAQLAATLALLESARRRLVPLRPTR